MKVAILRTKPGVYANHVLRCFERGVVKTGDVPLTVSLAMTRTDMANLERADVAFQICGYNKNHSGKPTDLLREASYKLSQQGKLRVLVMDTGFISNQYDYELLIKKDKSLPKFHSDSRGPYDFFDKTFYYSLGYDGIKGNAEYPRLKDPPPDRWRKLGVGLSPWRKDGDYVLLLAQTQWGQSSQHIDIYKWYEKVFASLKKFSKRPVVVRQHPRMSMLRTSSDRSRWDRNAIIKSANRVGLRISISENVQLDDDLEHAWAVVTFSTNACVRALIKGVPVFAGDRSCIAWEVADKDLRRIEDPNLPDRMPWLRKLSYYQWTPAEMASGECWRHYRPLAMKRRKKSTTPG